MLGIDVIAGFVGIGVALCASVAMYYWLGLTIDKKEAGRNEIRRATAFMTFGAFMSVAMLIPSVINPPTDASPFLPAILPIVMLSKFEAERDTLMSLHEIGLRYSMIILMGAQVCTMIIAVLWVFRHPTTSTTDKWILYTVGTLYTAIILLGLAWLFGLARWFVTQPPEKGDSIHHTAEYMAVPTEAVQSCM